MKRVYIIIVNILFSLATIAQTIGDAFYIYRNDGQFNAFFRDEVDSITYSRFGVDSLLYDETVTQVIYTQDSIYQIPLVAIDSVGFVTPDIIYREGSIPLTGDLFSFLIKSNGLELIFDSSLPTYLTPQIGEKLVTTEITDKLPYCFVGQVKQVSFSGEGIKVLCDSIGLEDAVSQFYGVYDIVVGENGEYRVRGPRKARTPTVYPYDLPFGRIQLPPMELTAFITEKDIFGIKSDINYKNSLEVTFTPQIHIKVTRVVDDLRFLSHTNLYVVTNADVEKDFDISGEASKDWKTSFLPKQDFPIPPGIPFYFDIGAKASLSGEITTGFTINSHIQQTTDITYYDATLIPMIGNPLSPIVNRVNGSISITKMDMAWNYFGADVEFRPCIYIRVGISALSHVTGWVGGEFEGGLNLSGKLMFDFNRLENAEPNTSVYEELENMAQIDIKPYISAHFMAAAFDDRFSFRLGNDFDTPLGTWYQGRILPRFSNTEATLLSDGKAQIKADITDDCFIPYTVGFALYDESGHHVQTKLNEEKYWTRHAFPSYSCEFDGLDEDKTYKAYPIIRFFGKYDMLASPSVNLGTSPLQLKELKQEHTTYADGNVTTSMKAVIDIESEQLDVDLSFYKDYGVYVKNNITGKEDYYSAKENGSMELYIPLVIPKEEFDADYNSFVAICDKFLFATYITDKEGETSIYDEREPQIIYDEKPSLTFTRASIGSITPSTYETGWYAYTQINVNYKATGTFWANPKSADFVIITTSYPSQFFQTTRSMNISIIDGEQSFTFTFAYFNAMWGRYDDKPCETILRFDLQLDNGNRVPSTNVMQIWGYPTIDHIQLINDLSTIGMSAPITESEKLPIDIRVGPIKE